MEIKTPAPDSLAPPMAPLGLTGTSVGLMTPRSVVVIRGMTVGGRDIVVGMLLMVGVVIVTTGVVVVAGVVVVVVFELGVVDALVVVALGVVVGPAVVEEKVVTLTTTPWSRVRVPTGCPSALHPEVYATALI